jgi:hypothetical protein
MNQDSKCNLQFETGNLKLGSGYLPDGEFDEEQT